MKLMHDSHERCRPRFRAGVLAEAAYQGVPGAFSELALKRAFPGVKTTACEQFSDAFQIVASGQAYSALLPVENSTEGSVSGVYDLLLKHDVVAIAEVVMKVRHMLIANPGTALGDVTRVYSHPQALAQCRDYIERNGYEAVEHRNTAGAVKMLRERRLIDAAAIASENAAALYGMRILERGIEDVKSNCTRFLLIARRGEEGYVRKAMGIARSGPCKTSIIFGLPHEPGSLCGVLREFERRGVNLTKIDSRPTKEKPWEYVFHVDFEGDAGARRIREMIGEIRRITSFLRVVGCYRVVYSEQSPPS